MGLESCTHSHRRACTHTVYYAQSCTHSHFQSRAVVHALTHSSHRHTKTLTHSLTHAHTGTSLSLFLRFSLWWGPFNFSPAESAGHYLRESHTRTHTHYVMYIVHDVCLIGFVLFPCFANCVFFWWYCTECLYVFMPRDSRSKRALELTLAFRLTWAF